ncbi:ATP-binding cassette domain-containing protein [Rothia sp. ZJ1223]|uniref:ATP-binding cassette domain-containing protein n=1 Tax=Rothia sp. ZJ1223 TaxID=2811098 RepID=UPI00351C7E85
MPRKLRKARVKEALEAVALTDRAGSKVQDFFSRGMKQRLHIARRLLNDPALLFLDEPTNGLDPELALDVRKFVKSLAQRGTGVLLTTHYLAEAQALTDNLLIINEGKNIFQGSLQELRAHSSLPEHATLEDACFAILGIDPDTKADA